MERDGRFRLETEAPVWTVTNLFQLALMDGTWKIVCKSYTDRKS